MLIRIGSIGIEIKVAELNYYPVLLQFTKIVLDLNV